MDDILEEVEKDKSGAQALLNDDELFGLAMDAWKDYANNSSSPSLATYLKDAQLEWKEGKLYITVTSQLAKSSILDQRPLFEKLREATSPHIPEIIFNIEQREFEENKAPKILTTKEKYEALKNSNPSLDNLIKELKLKIEE